MKKIIVLILLIMVTNIQPQEYDANPCYSGLSLVGSPKYGTVYSEFLINNFEKLELYEPVSENYPNYYNSWTSSMLRADTKSPQKYKGFSQGEGNPKLLNPEYVKWSCQYSPSSLMDKDPRTAWSEGVPGDGIGEVVIVRIDVTKPIKIWNGFGRNEKLYKENNRLKKIKVHGFVALDCSPAAMSFGSYSKFRYMDSYEYELGDQNSYQPLIISDSILKKYYETKNDLIAKGKGESFCNFNDEVLSFLVIEISSVYKGSKYSDTLISEITN
ncbi:NADase-type glycan-binding domain-containing protein [Leptospira santarosai]|uniref:NADase-type glycan-binding domain-containing protein n=1 Tax=Leptospira santarosai TaxID=28183 RepID=UPI000AD8C717